MPEEEIDRATLWIKGCQTKEGTCKDFWVKETANKILCVLYMSHEFNEAFKEKEQKGDLTISGANDVLTLALGTPEYNGRVREVGGYVQPSEYVNLSKCRNQSINETVRLSVRQILDEERDKIEVENL
ncbi:hypothetical protein M0R45_006483 [Rubus argutus]|uniref:Uncharacterized protein n=1 Tax=Rubus argutus TaxID=59490 RepID=A0AAW1YQJ1_RUBAR